MRNFEADKLVRIGDVMDFLAEYDAVIDLDVVGNALIGKAVDNA